MTENPCTQLEGIIQDCKYVGGISRGGIQFGLDTSSEIITLCNSGPPLQNGQFFKGAVAMGVEWPDNRGNINIVRGAEVYDEKGGTKLFDYSAP